jgi:cytochrome P450
MKTSISSEQTQRIPGPGLIEAVRVLRRMERDPLATLRELRRSYGDVAQMNLGIVRMVLLCAPADVKHVLQENHTGYDKNTFDWKLLKPVVGEGLLTSDGAKWLRQRRLMQPAFHRKRIAGFAAMMTECATRLGDRWEDAARDHTVLDVHAEMTRLTLEIVTRALFGTDVTGRAAEVGEAFTTLNRAAMSSFFSVLAAFPALLRWARPEAARAAAELDAIVNAIIEQRRRSGETHDDLLDLLIAARDDDTGAVMDDRQLRDEVLTLMIAGHETTASALSWTWALVSRHPEVERELHRELDRVLGGRTPTTDDLEALTYTRQVIEESMRLYPPAWLTSRNAVHDDQVGGHRIPEGSTVFLSPYLTHRHPDFWEDPDEFRPERFGSEASATREKFAYFPFGGGPRLCIGNTFAMTESILAVATLASRYTLRLETDQMPEAEALITLRPRDGVRMRVERRAEAEPHAGASDGHQVAIA